MRIPDAGLVELAVWTPLVVLTIAIGVWPKLVLGISSGAVSARHRGPPVTLVRTQSVDLVALLPVLIVAGTALLVLVADLFWPPQALAVGAGPLAGVAAALVSAFALGGPKPRTTFCLSPGACSYVEDRFAVAFQVIVLASTLVVLLLGRHELTDSRLPAGEYHFLLLASVVGALTMASSRDLLSLLVSLEVVSLPAFVLVGLRREDARSAEAALKFFLISVIATAVTLMGMSLVYGVTGSLQLDQIAAALSDQPPPAGDLGGDRADAGRVRVQGLGGAVPRLGARHLPGCAGAGCSVPVRGVQDRRLRGAGAAAVRRLPPVRRCLGSGARRPGRADHDRRQPGRAEATPCRTAAGLVLGRPGRLHPRAARGCGLPLRSLGVALALPSRRCWPTSRSTRR